MYASHSIQEPKLKRIRTQFTLLHTTATTKLFVAFVIITSSVISEVFLKKRKKKKSILQSSIC